MEANILWFIAHRIYSKASVKKNTALSKIGTETNYTFKYHVVFLIPLRGNLLLMIFRKHSNNMYKKTQTQDKRS